MLPPPYTPVADGITSSPLPLPPNVQEAAPAANPSYNGLTSEPSTVFDFQSAMQNGMPNFSLVPTNPLLAPGAAMTSGTVSGPTGFGGFYTNGSLEASVGPAIAWWRTFRATNGDIMVATPVPAPAGQDPYTGTVSVQPYVGY
jgi:hypothetical protein